MRSHYGCQISVDYKPGTFKMNSFLKIDYFHFDFSFSTIFILRYVLLSEYLHHCKFGIIASASITQHNDFVN